jgi:molybdopterin-guanine dinucleotide biosynthesis protein A
MHGAQHLLQRLQAWLAARHAGVRAIVLRWQHEFGARSAGQDHPVFGLWPVRLGAELRRAMDEGVRKVDVWTARYRLAVAEFAAAPFDPFFNANRPADLAEAERLLGQSRP